MSKANLQELNSGLYDFDEGFAEREFETIEEAETVDDFSDSTRLFKKLNEINWNFTESNTSFLTHDLHPYPAKFIPQIPSHLISKMSLRGELILDPFGGSGTTAFEAIRLGRTAISLDANPVSKVIGKAKTTFLLPEELESIRHLISAVRDAYTRVTKGSIKHMELFELHKRYIPDIPNVEKWFTQTALSELGMLRHLIETIVIKQAKNVALTSFIKTVMKVCNQESETRYASVDKEIIVGQAFKSFSSELTVMMNKITESTGIIRNAVVDFQDADARVWDTWNLEPESVSLIVTSPPYPNAYDYHLYHRFRIFWLGRDPGELRNVEIGSHLRHQSKKDGFESYVSEMSSAMSNMRTALQPGRYAALVVGNGIYKGTEYETGKELLKLASEIGLEPIGRIERNLPISKRSVTAPGRRLQREDIIILRKPQKTCFVNLGGPYYSLFEYEKDLQYKEVSSINGVNIIGTNENGKLKVACPSDKLPELRKLSFIHSYELEGAALFRTWQSQLEEPGLETKKARKEPKYVTHGIHTYKGKFYPQLAKALINISNPTPGATILDPFMGSGTVLLESYLNGYRGIGMDMNPLAFHIAGAKLEILDENPDFVEQTVTSVLRRIREVSNTGKDVFSEFPHSCHEEIKNWFPEPVIAKLNNLLKIIRSLGSPNVIKFLEICTSDMIRDVSHQDPKDLRIRKRQVLLEDAPVYEMFTEKVSTQLERLRQYWRSRAYCPTKLYKGNLSLGDNRQTESYRKLGILDKSVDLIVTSPPYFTALPYIDTDRLSLLTILGIPRKESSIIEREITGSREISKSEKLLLESAVDRLELPHSVYEIIERIQNALMMDSTAGFRRQNVPALMLRYFNDMDLVMKNLYRVLKQGGLAWIVIGNNKTSIGDEEFLIDSVSLLKDIAVANGFKLYDEINITVTRENMKHIRNSIIDNGVLGFIKE